MEALKKMTETRANRILNGWQRIGILASVVWILGAGFYTQGSEFDRLDQMIVAIHVDCDSNSNRAGFKTFDECNKQSDDAVTEAIRASRQAAAIVAFVPVLPGWGFAYLVVFLTRWVRRGFFVKDTAANN